MTSLKLFGTYNLCARFVPGFLFVVSIYFLLGLDMQTLQNNSIVFTILIIILSGICGFASSAIIKIIEQLLWKRFENPTIIYLKRCKIKIYNELLEKYKTKELLITNILKTTRKDSKLFWKNVSYGFFRNSILLSFISLCFSYPTQYFYINIAIFIFILAMTFMCSLYYAHQAIESYQEVMIKAESKANNVFRLLKSKNQNTWGSLRDFCG